MVSVSAPGKVILFGEHAVVFGEPALSIAIDRRFYLEAKEGESFTVNRNPLTRKGNEYIRKAIDLLWNSKPLTIETRSEIPRAAGMGSSAAVAVATSAALLEMQGGFDEERVAKCGFQVEYEVQEGMASPIDTSTSTHGSGILVATQKHPNFLWQVQRWKKSWFIHHVDLPEMELVVGDTGIHAPTGPLVAKVHRFAERSQEAREAIREIGQITKKALRALQEGDLTSVGNLMNRNHELLVYLGVGHPLLEKFVKAARRRSYGAKLTGAGGGGSMIAMTEEPEEVVEALEALGARTYRVRTEKKGVQVVN